MAYNITPPSKLAANTNHTSILDFVNKYIIPNVEVFRGEVDVYLRVRPIDIYKSAKDMRVCSDYLQVMAMSDKLFDDDLYMTLYQSTHTIGFAGGDYFTKNVYLGNAEGIELGPLLDKLIREVNSWINSAAHNANQIKFDLYRSPKLLEEMGKAFSEAGYNVNIDHFTITISW